MPGVLSPAHGWSQEAGRGERLRCYSIALAGPTPPESHPHPWETVIPTPSKTKREAYGGDLPKGTKSSNKGRNGEPSPPDPRAHHFTSMPSESRECAPPEKGPRGWIATQEEPRTRPSQPPPERHVALGNSSTRP